MDQPPESARHFSFNYTELTIVVSRTLFSRGAPYKKREGRVAAPTRGALSARAPQYAGGPGVKSKRRGKAMRHVLPTGPEQRQEVLRRLGIALKGRGVGVCEADSRGHLRLVAANRAEDLGPIAVDDVKATLRRLSEVPEADRTPRLWVAGRSRQQGWCVAPVRGELPQPPPAGVERRSLERLTLELGGVCIGLIKALDREATV